MQGLQRLDITDPSQPSLVQTLLPGSCIFDLAVVAPDRIYVADADGSIHEVEIDSQGGLSLNRSESTAAAALSIAMDGNLAIVGEDEYLEVFRCTSYDLVNIASEYTLGVQFTGVAVSQFAAAPSYLYAGRSDGLVDIFLIDREGEYPLSYAGSIALGGPVVDVTAADGALLMVGCADKLAIFDISEAPDEPELVGEMALPAGARGMLAVGDAIYFANDRAGLHIVSSEALQPPLYGNVFVGGRAMDLATDGQWVYVVAGENGLVVLPAQCGAAMSAPEDGLVVGPGFGPLRVVPNPTSDRVTVLWESPQPQVVLGTVHDVRGRQVRRLFSGPVPAGAQALLWDGRDAAGQRVAAGTYWVRVSGERGSRVARVVTLR